MQLNQQHVGACFCGGTTQALPHVKLTPRQWLERRWQRQAAGSINNSRRSDVILAAAASALSGSSVLPTKSYLTTHSSDSTVTWDELVLHAPRPQQSGPAAFVAGPQLLRSLQLSRPPKHIHKVPQNLQHKHTQQMQQPDAVMCPEQDMAIAVRDAATGQQHADYGFSKQQQQHAARPNSTAAPSSTAAASLVSSQQLMASIKSSKSVQALHKLYSSSSDRMDDIHCISMLNRLAHVWSSTALRCSTTNRLSGNSRNRELGTQHGQQQQQRHQSQGQLASQHKRAVVLLEVLLDDLLAKHLAACKAREISSALWVIGRFSKAATSSITLQEAATALLQRMLQPVAQNSRFPRSRLNGHHAVAGAAQSLHTSTHEGNSNNISVDANRSASCQLLEHCDTDAGFAQQLAGLAPKVQQQTQPHANLFQPQAQGGEQQYPHEVGLLLKQQQDQQQDQQQQVQLLLHSANPTDLANMLWALGRLAQVLDFHSLLQPPLQQQQQIGRHQQQQQSVLYTLEQACSQQLLAAPRCDGQFVANCLFGFAHMGHRVPQLFSAIVQRLGFNYCKHLQSQHVVVISWALSKLGHYDKDLTSRLLWRAVVVRHALRPEGVAILLSAAGKVRHEADPRTIAQLLQVIKQPGVQLPAKELSLLLHGLLQLRLLQQHRRWVLGNVLQQAMRQLPQLQPVAVATVLQVLMELSRSEPPAAAASARTATGASQNAASETYTSIEQPQQQHSLLSKRVQASCSSLSSSGAGSDSGTLDRLAGVATPVSAHYPPNVDLRQMMPLYRELSKHIAFQLPQTKPQTLYNITVALAALGYYDARLYTKLSSALAAAAELHIRQDGDITDDNSSVQQQHRPPPFTVQQCVHLLGLFAHFQHPAPALWTTLLPHMVAAGNNESSSSSSMPLWQQLQVLVASSSRGCSTDVQVTRGLMRMAVAVLLQQNVLNVAELVSLAAAAARLGSVAQQQECSDAGSQQLGQQLNRQLHRLVPRLMSAVLAQPQQMPVLLLPRLLEAAVLLQQSGSNSGMQQQQYLQDTVTVGQRQLQRLSDVAVEHLASWTPTALLTLLRVHTQAPLLDLMVADAYAEELVLRIDQCSVQVLVEVLSVLANACVSHIVYSHSRLLAVAMRQFHGKLLLATACQLTEAVAALEQLQQEGSAVYKAAMRMLESVGEEQ